MSFKFAIIFACLAGLKTAIAAPVEGFNNKTVHYRREDSKQLWQESFGPLKDDIEPKGPDSLWFATTLKRLVELDFMSIQNIFTDKKAKFTAEELKEVHLQLTMNNEKNVPVTLDLSNTTKLIKNPDSANSNLWVTAIEAGALKLNHYEGLQGDKITPGSPADAMRMLTSMSYGTGETDGSNYNTKWLELFDKTPVFCKTYDRKMNYEGVLEANTWFAIVGYEKKGDSLTDLSEMKLIHAGMKEPVVVLVQQAIQDSKYFVGPK
ncbi:hypothetical protein I316_01161 [Kwoniella heveanensis BCC8398]|uniref:Calpain catalytic domain-containing protein n=1 Tax=Kwoniella heveanensis BCC8398 TaxID=1296120 RepID=A0A1B9H1V7_9TREE|nr:hypothetical protein I316_01161 [Kwoniella heveanensis BCC8398]